MEISSLFDEIEKLEFDMISCSTSSWYAAQDGDWTLSAEKIEEACMIADKIRDKARLLRNKIYDCRVARKE